MQQTWEDQQPPTPISNPSSPWWSPRDLTPGYFALVMASGIISVACYLLDYMVLSTVLLVMPWPPISLTYNNHSAFFTFVAGTAVLGTRIAFSAWWTLAAILLGIAGVTWLVLGYVIPIVAVLGKSERPTTQAANGLWFVLIVGAQSVAVLATTLEPILHNARNFLAITAVFAWSLGLILYVAIAVFVALRLVTFPLNPREFNPPYWVSMGAIAITPFVGSHSNTSQRYGALCSHLACTR